MNHIFARRLVLLISFVALTGLAGNQARAETGDTIVGLPTASLVGGNNDDTSLETQLRQWRPQKTNGAKTLLGTTELTTTAGLMADVLTLQARESANKAAEPAIAQRDIDPGRPTRSGDSYVGVGIEIGFNDSGSPLGNGGFAIYSKIGLLEEVSVRPTAVFGDDVVLMVPVTLDFPPEDTEETGGIDVAPYVGGGLAIAIGDETNIGVFGTAGVDAALTSEFTATAALNVGFVDELEVGLLIGGSYTF